MERENSNSSLHGWTLVDHDQEEQVVSGSSRSSSISGHWSSSKDVEDATKQQSAKNAAPPESETVTNDRTAIDISDETSEQSDGEVVAIEEDTDDHLEGWETAQRQTGPCQCSLNTSWVQDDDECSMGESDTSSHSGWQVPPSSVRQRSASEELRDEDEVEALPLDYPAGYAPTTRAYVHRRNEELNRGLTVYVVMMAVLVALLAMGHFGGTLIVTRHAHYGAPVDVAQNMRRSMGVVPNGPTVDVGGQGQHAEVFLKLHQMMKTQGELKRRISALEDENRALRLRLADSRKLLTRIVHKAPVFNISTGQDGSSWSKRASLSASAGLTLSDIVHLHEPKDEVPRNFHRLQKAGLASVLANKSSLQQPSRPALTKVTCSKPASPESRGPASWVHRLRNDTKWKGMKAQVESIKRDLYNVKERYQEVNRSHIWKNLSTVPPSSQHKHQSQTSRESKDSKYAHCGLGGTLYNDYCYLTPNKYRAASNQPSQKRQPEVKAGKAGWYWKTHDPLRLWHTLQHLSRTKKIKKALKKWTYDLVSVSSPFLKDTIAHVPKRLQASKDWVSCQWKWWQKAVQHTGGEGGSRWTMSLNSSPGCRDDGWRPKCKDGQCKPQEVPKENRKRKKETPKVPQGQTEKKAETLGKADWYSQRAVDRARYRLSQVKQWKTSNLTLTSWLFERARGRQVQREQQVATDYNETPTRQEAIPADPIYAFLKHRAAARALNRYP
ncbi:hypothetical protein RvY_17591 [Ramazzottius varieornatus]|uniref:Uncharacterized protein n=1 Tax=Ramazzottius varieornatus TaxID=947166 RepID=A0A1D1W2N3_RAMVA|nr:hypothetical protein RvY_17591 [Ramazzottius varieornatus]